MFQEQSKFAKSCAEEGGLFKCCVSDLTLREFEKIRTSLIKKGLIKGKPTSWCTPGLERKDPCLGCMTDAMCTKRDLTTGEIKHTFITKYKKEHRVMKKHFYLINICFRLGDIINPLTHVMAIDFHCAVSGTYVK